jgi:hypothetical protein
VRIKGLTSIKGIPTYKCDGCGLAKAQRNHRRQTREFQETLGKRIALDRYDFRAENSAVTVIKSHQQSINKVKMELQNTSGV